MPIGPHLMAVAIASLILSEKDKASLFSNSLAGPIFQMSNDTDIGQAQLIKGQKTDTFDGLCG